MKFKLPIIDKLEDVYRHRNEPEALRMLATLYWRSLLIIALAMLVFVFLYSTWTLQGVLAALNTAPDTFTAAPSPLDRASLESTLAAFDARTSTYANRAAHTSTFSDPSR